MNPKPITIILGLCLSAGALAYTPINLEDSSWGYPAGATDLAPRRFTPGTTAAETETSSSSVEISYGDFYRIEPFLIEFDKVSTAPPSELKATPAQSLKDWLKTPYKNRDGAADAIRDLQTNTARFCIYGKSAGLVFLKEWSALSEQRFGIKVEAIAGCMITEELVSYAESYNKILRAPIAENHGATAWEDCRNEAAEAWQKKHAQGNSDQ